MYQSPTPPTLLTDAAEVTGASSSVFVNLGLCQLNQWAMDFEGNCQRIMESIRKVKELGGYYRLGPELEVCGYSCDDHFAETDTTFFCWQTICRLLKSDLTNNCLVDIGMPLEHKSVRYNCRMFLLNKRIILIRPKMFLANDGAYREIRWFAAWKQAAGIEEFLLPKCVQRVNGQTSSPIGFAGIQCNDCLIASETCEELFVPQSPHLAMCLGGVDIFTNGSASYFQTGKLAKRFDLIMAPTSKMGGIYMYCNLKGNDGGKLAFDGASFIACNGEIVNLIQPFNIADVEVMVESVNVQRVRSFRACNPSYGWQAAGRPMPVINANIWLSGVDNSTIRVLAFKRDREHRRITLPEVPEELASGIALWLWDYLRRSGGHGFFLPLSGGADSACCACIVRVMCHSVMSSIERGVPGVKEDLERVLRMTSTDPAFPKNDQQMCFQLLHTAYMATSINVAESRACARTLAQQVGSYHLELEIEEMFQTEIKLASSVLKLTPKFVKEDGSPGTHVENLALQNLQARLRMQVGYFIASLLPLARSRDRLAPPPKELDGNSANIDESKCGFLISLGTGNLDETYRGYYTKFDCSAGDLAPIGSISKVNVRRILKWMSEVYPIPIAQEIAIITPTAELRPPMLKDGELLAQTDEDDMGLSYEEIYLFGNLMKAERMGPLEMYERLIRLWRSRGVVRPTLHGGQSPGKHPVPSADDQPSEDVKDVTLSQFLRQDNLNETTIAQKVKHFFVCYALNRHKTSSLPPSYHAEAHDGDATRFDWRPTLYPPYSNCFQYLDNLAELAKKKPEKSNVE